MKKYRILLQGNYGLSGELTDECIDFIESKGGKYPDILHCRHDPILLEMFDKFAITSILGNKILKTKDTHAFFYVGEISDDTYFIQTYDGRENVKIHDDFKWIKIN